MRLRHPFLAALCFPLLAHAQITAERQGEFAHVMLGQLDSDDAWTIVDDSSGEALSDGFGDLIYGGGSVQVNYNPNADSVWEYGFEGGGLISYKNSTTFFSASGGGDGFEGTIAVDNEFLVVDLTLGGYVAARPANWLRIYASGGPSFAWGSLSVADDELVVTPESGDFDYRPGSRKRDTSTGLYGRLGFDILFNNGFALGLSARWQQLELDFGSAGEFDIDEPQVFLTFGARL